MNDQYVDISPELLGKADPDQQWIEKELDRIDPWRGEQGHEGADAAALRKLVLELRHSLRDMFAAKAMQAVIARGDDTNRPGTAEWSYAMSDAMLKARAA